MFLYNHWPVESLVRALLRNFILEQNGMRFKKDSKIKKLSLNNIQNRRFLVPSLFILVVFFSLNSLTYCYAKAQNKHLIHEHEISEILPQLHKNH